MLKCIKDFRQNEYEFLAGNYVVVNPALESWLIDSFPAHFVRESIDAPPAIDEAPEPVEVEQADMQAPPADKAIKRPRARK